MNHVRRRPTPALPALALATALAACSDPGTESFDPAASAGKTQAAYQLLSGNPGVQGFAALSGKLSFAGAPPAAPATAAPASPADILPAGALGKTFGYVPQTGKYAATDQTGGPANGVRFVLYDVDPVQHTLRLPLAPVGYLDLTNVNAPVPNGLGIRAVVGSVTAVDYTASGSAVGGGLSVSAKGNAANGTGRLDFDLAQAFSQQSGIKLDYRVSTTTPDVAIQVVATTPAGSTQSTVVLTVTESPHTLEVSATGNDAAVQGTVKYNGSTLARISGTGKDPVFTGQGGRQLTAAELAGLRQLFDFVDQLFDGVDDLLIPAYFVLGFGP